MVKETEGCIPFICNILSITRKNATWYKEECLKLLMGQGFSEEKDTQVKCSGKEGGNGLKRWTNLNHCT